MNNGFSLNSFYQIKVDGQLEARVKPTLLNRLLFHLILTPTKQPLHNVSTVCGNTLVLVGLIILAWFLFKWNRANFLILLQLKHLYSITYASKKICLKINFQTDPYSI